MIKNIILFIILFLMGYLVLFGQSFEVESVKKLNFPDKQEVNFQNPKWSSDNKFISFEIWEKKSVELYIFSVDDGNRDDIKSSSEKKGFGESSRQRSGGVDYNLQWSYIDNSRLLFIGTGDEKETDLFGLVYRKKREPKPINITANLKPDLIKQISWVKDRLSVINYPVMVPESKRDFVVFTIGGKGDSEIIGLFDCFDDLRKTPEPITDNKQMFEYQPNISKDGKMIVFSGSVSGNSDIYIIRNFKYKMEKTEIVKLTDWESVENSPQFSPDGNYIAFLSERGHEKVKGLWIMNIDGSNKRELYPAVVHSDYGGFMWHPNNKYVFFVKSQGIERDPIVYIDVNSNKIFQLDTGTSMNSQINISKDGTKITFCAQGETKDSNLTWTSAYFADLKSK